MILRRCLRCPRRFGRVPAPWRCAGCGGPLDFEFTPPAEALRDLFHSSPSSREGIGRWLPALPLEEPDDLISRGEGGTPLVEESFRGVRVRLLLDHLNPTGSYKDRGAAVMVADLRRQRGRYLVEDSSGNAGAALALYATAVRRTAVIFVPAGTSEGKLRLIQSFRRPSVVECEGPTAAAARQQAASRAQVESRRRRRIYASHVWQPAFRHGVKTAAYEIASALGRPAPAAVVFPAGNGVLALGLALGFSDLHAAGLLDRPPLLIGVQAAACAPLARAFSKAAGMRRAAEERGETACEGIRVATPPLEREVVAAVAASGGKMLTVKEHQARAALDGLWKRGYAVELTCAVVAAVLTRYALRWRRRFDSLGLEGPLVGILTGSGLKGDGGKSLRAHHAKPR